MKVWAAIHQGPSSAGIALHFAPFSCRQMIAAMVRRRWRGGTLACGRQPSINGSNVAQRSSVSMACLRKSKPNAAHLRFRR